MGFLMLLDEETWICLFCVPFVLSMYPLSTKFKVMGSVHGMLNSNMDYWSTSGIFKHFCPVSYFNIATKSESYTYFSKTWGMFTMRSL